MRAFRHDALIPILRGRWVPTSMPRGLLRIEKAQVKFIVLAERFEKGAWRYWEHECDRDEIRAFEDFAFTNAHNLGIFTAPTAVDYLRGAEYTFNTLSDPRETPIDGDTRVFGVKINRIVIARHDELRLYSQVFGG